MFALVGSGEYLPEMEIVDRSLLAGLGANPLVVCLPTAAGTESPERISYWSKLGVDYFKNLGITAKSLPVITRQDAQDVGLAAQVSEARFVYLSGGKPNYLLATLKDSQVWQAILTVLQHGGVLAGCSAGAMILGEKVPGFPGWQSAFNLLEGAIIIPHFDEISTWMVPLARIWIGRNSRIVGVPGYTALAVDGNNCKVFGKGNVILKDHHGTKSFSPGESFNW